MFERARCPVGATRWHLFNLCGAFEYGDQTRPTAEVPIQLVCIRCARLARTMLSQDEQSQPHGRNILVAAERSINNALSVSPVSDRGGTR